MNTHTSSSLNDGADARRCGRRALGYALAALLTGAGLVACSDPDDSTHGAGSVTSVPEACAPGRAFAPLLAPRAVLDSGIAGGCIACRVVNPDAVVDADPENFATLQVGLGLVGTAFISVLDSARINPPGTRVGFLVAGDDGAAIPLTVAVGQQTTITTFLKGVEQDSTRPSNDNPPLALQILELPILLPGAPQAETRFIGLVTERDFDQVRLDFGGAVNLLNSFRVFNVCMGDAD
jgi:hypothetical protein